MSVVAIDRNKPYTQETTFTILCVLGIPDIELKEVLEPELYEGYKKFVALHQPSMLSNPVK